MGARLPQSRSGRVGDLAKLPAGRLGGHLETLTVLIPRSGSHRQALAIAAGETAALVGWAAYDVGDPDTARHHYKTAAPAGREAGHPAVVALAMGRDHRL
ncbi:hypothetical protein [Streptomyces poriticola]|uniref:hypothetical protein n=1 Tax=Streptomyces poriticola TaxID=3120506 RepID=UPI002FCE5D21